MSANKKGKVKAAVKADAKKAEADVKKVGHDIKSGASKLKKKL